MKIVTYNINGIGARLPNLLRWLKETSPDVVCLQELKAPQENFPEAAIREAGYGVIWHGQKSWNGVAILARGCEPAEIRRALPGDPEDAHSRYIEATVRGVTIGCLYLPNGNPAPGPKFDYKLRWLERLIGHAAELAASPAPVVLAGDYNVIPAEQDVYKPERWVNDALFRVEVARGVRAPQGAGLDRCDPYPASGGEDLYLLGLLPRCLRARCGPAHRSPVAQQGAATQAHRRRRRPGRARLGAPERPCADLDHARAVRLKTVDTKENPHGR